MTSSVSGPRGDHHRAILAIALPSMLTNVATALFGLADMWVIGRLGDPTAQGGVEVGAKFLATLLIIFNFLRSGTVALTAQAAGREDDESQAATLVRGLAVAVAVGAVLLVIRTWVVPLGMTMLGAKGRVAELASLYIHTRYLGGVAWLINCVLVGWLIGRKQMRPVLMVEVGSNLFHIALDVTLVLGFGLGIAGVAVATLCSELAKLLALLVIVGRQGPAKQALALLRRSTTWQPSELSVLFRMNRDLFLRTLLLMSVTVLMTRFGAQQGPVTLAANAIILQLFMLSALVLDGFESAAQVLCAEALGALDRTRFSQMVRQIMLWGGGMALVIAGVYAVWGNPLAASFSTDASVQAATLRFGGWSMALPVLGIASFILDGVFIGSSWTRGMLISMAGGLLVFTGLLFATPGLGNHGLWLAYGLFFVARAVGQALLMPGLMRKSFDVLPVTGGTLPVPDRS